MGSIKEKTAEFTQIYQDYLEKIYRFVYLKVNSPETAEDITSKVFLKCWEAYRDGKVIDNMNAFLYRTANNAVIDYYRQGDRKNIVSSEHMGHFADTKPGLYEKVVLSAELEDVKQALRKVKQEYQDVIIWHYLEDMTIKEIAQMTGKTEGNIRVIAHRGLKELKDILESA